MTAGASSRSRRNERPLSEGTIHDPQKPAADYYGFLQQLEFGELALLRHSFLEANDPGDKLYLDAVEAEMRRRERAAKR